MGGEAAAFEVEGVRFLVAGGSARVEGDWRGLPGPRLARLAMTAPCSIIPPLLASGDPGLAELAALIAAGKRRSDPLCIGELAGWLGGLDRACALVEAGERLWGHLLPPPSPLTPDPCSPGPGIGRGGGEGLRGGPGGSPSAGDDRRGAPRGGPPQ